MATVSPSAPALARLRVVLVHTTHPGNIGAAARALLTMGLERLVLVPRPGDHWLAVTAAIADTLGIVALRPPARASESSISRLAARLRQRGTTLFVLGSWPHSEAMLSLDAPRWHGIGDGHGHLTAREVTVTVTSRVVGRPRSARVWLPDADAAVSPVSSVSPVSEVRTAPAVAVAG